MAKKGTARDTVADVMVPDVMTIEPTATLAAAARLMDEGNIGMLPVVEDEQVRGVITDRDIVVRAVARDADASNLRVGDCLTSNVVCAHPGWTTEKAMKMMAEHQVGRLPVVDDNGCLVGVVTLSSMAFRAPDKEETLETGQEVSRRSARDAA